MKLKSLLQKIYKKTVIGLFTTCLLVTGIAFYLPLHGRRISVETLDHFYQRSPDTITVFTGDRGRIEGAFNLAKKMPGAKLLITGVHNDNSLKTIANQQITSLSPDQFVSQYAHLVEIDYEAKNTIENVLNTLVFARQEKALDKIIVVSSDYHIARIKLILSFLKEDKDKMKFFFHAIPTSPSKFSNVKRYIKEVFRFIKTTAVLLLWD